MHHACLMVGHAVFHGTGAEKKRVKKIKNKVNNDDRLPNF